VVAWKPRRQRLGGVCDGAAVDDGGVGSQPARPNDPAAPKRRGLPPAPDPASTPAVTGKGPLRRVAGPLCLLVCLRIPWQGEAHRDRNGGRCAGDVSGRVPVPASACGASRSITRVEGKGDIVKKPKARLDAWAEAQKRFHLSDLHIQMARELGLNPKKFGGLANHRQEPWKLPLPEFIAECYRKRFHREQPAQVVPLAEVAKRQQQSARDKVRHARAHTDA
jgi:hypothetical protein